MGWGRQSVGDLDRLNERQEGCDGLHGPVLQRPHQLGGQARQKANMRSSPKRPAGRPAARLTDPTAILIAHLTPHAVPDRRMDSPKSVCVFEALAGFLGSPLKCARLALLARDEKTHRIGSL